MKQLAENAERLADQKMSNGEIDAVLDVMFPITEDASERQKRNAAEQRDKLVACMFAPDLVQFFGTKYGFLNAVSDFVGHGDPQRHTKSYEENRWGTIITGHPMLDLAMSKIK